MVDTGLMRNELRLLHAFKKYKLNVKLVDSSNLFIKKLKNVINPEKKKIIGQLFIKIFEKEKKI